MILNVQNLNLDLSAMEALDLIETLTKMLKTKQRGYQNVMVERVPVAVEDGVWNEGPMLGKPRHLAGSITLVMIP